MYKFISSHVYPAITISKQMLYLKFVIYFKCNDDITELFCLVLYIFSIK